MAAGALTTAIGPRLMKRMLLATTAAVACLMLTPSAEARSTSRPEHAVAVSVEAGDGAGDRFLSVAQAAPTEDDEDEEDDDEEDDSDDEEDEDEEDEEDEDEDDEGDEDDGSATADPVPGAVTDGQDDIAADDADEHEDEDEDENEEDDPFPSAPGTLNATIGGTATLQAGVFGDSRTASSSATRRKWTSTSGARPTTVFYTA